MRAVMTALLLLVLKSQELSAATCRAPPFQMALTVAILRCCCNIEAHVTIDMSLFQVLEHVLQQLGSLTDMMSIVQQRMQVGL